MTNGPAGDAGGREVLFEFVQVGAQVRVAAIDAATGAEAIVIGPANAARVDLERLALRKLLRQLGKISEEENDEKPVPSGRGRIV